MMITRSPLRFAISIGPRKATHELIQRSGEFGLSFCSDRQATLSHIAGSYSLRDTYKWRLGDFPVYAATKINAPMIDQCLANVECRLVSTQELCDHTLFIGDGVWLGTMPRKNRSSTAGQVPCARRENPEARRQVGTLGGEMLATGYRQRSRRTRLRQLNKSVAAGPSPSLGSSLFVIAGARPSKSGLVACRSGHAFGLWATREKAHARTARMRGIASRETQLSLPRFPGHLDCGDLVAQGGVRDGYQVPTRVPEAGGRARTAA